MNTTRAESAEVPFDEVERLRAENQRLCEALALRGAAAEREELRYQRTMLELSESERRLTLALDAAVMGIWEWALGDTLVWCPRVRRIFGVAPCFEPRLEDWRELLHPDDRAMVAARLEASLTSGGDYRVEHRIVRPDGQTRWVQCLGYVSLDEAGRPAIVRGTVVDVSERKALEQQLLHSQKVEIVGRLAGGIAHDFNNLLTAIGGALMLSQRHAQGNPALCRHLGMIGEASEHAGHLTRQLLTFARKQVVSVESCEIDELVCRSQSLLVRLLGEDIDLRVDTGASSGMVRADQHQLEQVFFNLCINAREAMPRGGTLAIATRCASTTTGEWLVVSISDTGLGMTDEVERRAFEPFFTTKSSGSGLGLSICAGIIEQAGGTIKLESASGVGTTFELWLPRSQGRAAPAPGATAWGDSAGGETVLLVEDAPLVRDVMSQCLEERGYRVLTARDPREALAAVGPHLERLDAVVVDMVLPGIDGVTMAEQLSVLHPEARFLFVSGYSPEVLATRLEDADVAILAKPYQPETLARRVRELLDGEDGNVQRVL